MTALFHLGSNLTLVDIKHRKRSLLLAGAKERIIKKTCVERKKYLKKSQTLFLSPISSNILKLYCLKSILNDILARWILQAH